MSNREKHILHIFKMCAELAKLYDNDDEVIADITYLLKKHARMFNYQAANIIKTIDEIISDPNMFNSQDMFVAKNHNPRKDTEYQIAKRNLDFQPEKMGDVIIGRDKDTNVAFHANKLASWQFDRLKRRAEREQLMVGVSNPHTSRPAEPDASNETLPGANALSPTAETIIPQNSNKSQVSTKNSHNQAQEPKQPRADEILFNGYKEIRQEQESNITQTTQQPSVDGDIDTNTSPRGPRR